MRKITFLLLAMFFVWGVKAQTVIATMQDLVSAANVNTATVPTDWEVSSETGGIYSFDGSTYIGEITHEAAVSAFEGDKIVTVAMWVYGNVTNSGKCIWGYGDQSTGVKIQLNAANTGINATTKGVADLDVVTDSRLSPQNWTLVAVSFPGKTNTTENVKGRIYLTATNGTYWTKEPYKLSGMNTPAETGQKFAIGSGNQGSVREAFSGMIANVTIITSDALLENSVIAGFVGDAPRMTMLGLKTALPEKVETIQSLIGTDPGYYPSTTATPVIEAANAALANSASTQDELQAQLDALNALQINMPVAGKTYQIVSAYPDYETKQGVKKAMFAGDYVKDEATVNIVKWGTISVTDKKFFWTFTGNGTGYSVANLSTGEYMGTWADNKQPLTSEPVAITLESLGQGQFRIKNSGNIMHTEGHSSGAGVNGPIVNWGGELNSCSSWYIMEAEVKIPAIVTYQYKEGDDVVWQQEVTGIVGETNPAPTFHNNFVTFEYPTQTLTGDATIEVTPIFNMPFVYGSTIEEAPVVALDIHGNEAKYPLYHSDAAIKVEYTANTDADDYTRGAVKSMDYAWKFVGDPIRGFQLYNVAAGLYAVHANNIDDVITLGENGSVFQVYNSGQSSNEKFDKTTAFCLKRTDFTYYLNHRGNQIQAWKSNDGGSSLRAYTINAENASYVLTLKAQYGTICLPFYSAIPEGITLYTNNAVGENNVLTLVPAGTLLKANTPYIVEGTTPGTYTFTNTSTSTVTENVTTGCLTGVMTAETTTIPEGSYVLALNKTTGKQAFYITDGTVVCPQYKCYFTAPATTQGVKAFYFDNNGETTGIESIFGGNDGEVVIYNLAGQRINKLQKGINIVNGRKVLVK